MSEYFGRIERLSRKKKILGNICSFEQLFYRKKSLGASVELKCLHESKNILCIYCIIIWNFKIKIQSLSRQKQTNRMWFIFLLISLFLHRKLNEMQG